MNQYDFEKLIFYVKWYLNNLAKDYTKTMIHSVLFQIHGLKLITDYFKFKSMRR